ncbi:hypothetical protein LOC68_09865 [Blastopirellula sp. JC732]|uniref:Uncharacterized protein n=1 Tax=Blastopirellula sediminis TaxID=2894196 RepID=A0A9X1ML54_9BACT|nr:phage tail tube protein [Blastopirellula sediminis]MCC9608519.1 hypothetical protein [Blastopirellula sediminis]MCC9628704.1 hypothetical protein [Blastopirellula sediminis]
MSVTHVSGFQTQLGLGPQHATNLATRQLEHFGVDLDKQSTIVRADGMIGQRSPIGDSAQPGTYTVGGTISLRPRPDDLLFLFPYILGAAEVSDAFALAETLPELVATVDRKIMVNTYRGLKVDKATFRSRKGELLELELDLQGKLADATAAAGTFPSIAATLSAKNPFVHHQSSVTIDETTIEVDNLVITIDNALELDRFNNSQTRTTLPEGSRRITLAFDTELNDDVLANLIETAARGVTAEVEFANGVDTLTFTFGLVQQPKTPLSIRGKGTTRPRHQLEAFADLANGLPQLAVVCTDAS